MMPPRLPGSPRVNAMVVSSAPVSPLYQAPVMRITRPVAVHTMMVSMNVCVIDTNCLNHRVARFRSRSRNRCSAEAGFVGEDATGHTHAYSQHNGGAGETAGCGGRRESAMKDEGECWEDSIGIDDKDNHGGGQVENDHEGYECPRHAGDAPDAPKDHNACRDSHEDAGDAGMHSKPCFDGVGDRV